VATNRVTQFARALAEIRAITEGMRLTSPAARQWIDKVRKRGAAMQSDLSYALLCGMALCERINRDGLKALYDTSSVKGAYRALAEKLVQTYAVIDKSSYASPVDYLRMGKVAETCCKEFRANPIDSNRRSL
jgi:hypothetical protein